MRNNNPDRELNTE